MIHDNIEFHNAAELTPIPNGGLRLQRCPESVRMQINENAQQRMLSPAGCEIRMAADGPIRITLSSEETSVFTVFWGMFQETEYRTVTGKPAVFEFERHPRLDSLAEEDIVSMPFAPNICRLVFGGNPRGPVMFHKAEGKNLRPPKAEELPDIRFMIYGTSITHGSSATGAHLTYAAQTARRLGADLINLGVGGAALAEPELADYMASRDDWDIAALALSVNMANQGFTPDTFYERVAYMVKTVAGVHPDKPVAAITIYPYYGDIDARSVRENTIDIEAFRQKLRDAVTAADCTNLHIIEGPELLKGFEGLGVDLLHPADNGMIQMGENLARKLQKLL